MDTWENKAWGYQGRADRSDRGGLHFLTVYGVWAIDINRGSDVIIFSTPPLTILPQLERFKRDKTQSKEAL